MDLIRQEEREGLILLVNILSPRWRDLVIKEKETRGEHPASSHLLQLPHSTIFYFLSKENVIITVGNINKHYWITVNTVIEEKLWFSSSRRRTHWEEEDGSNRRDLHLNLQMNLLESIDLKWKCIEEKNEQACWRTITGIISKI